MTLVEYLKSDSDVVRLIFFSIGATGLLVYLVYSVATKFGFWRRKALGKPRRLQRPFLASQKISPTPKDGSPTFRISHFNHWSPNKWSSSPSTPSTSKLPVKTSRQLLYSSPLKETQKRQQQQQQKQKSPIIFLNHIISSVNRADVEQQQQKQQKRFLLGQVISSINKSDAKQVGRRLPLKKSRLDRNSSKRYEKFPVLDTSTTTDDSTLPSLVLSSEGSTENITENYTSEVPATMDKGVNTETIDDGLRQMTYTQPAYEAKLARPLRKDNFTSHLWSHKCQLPCLYEVKAPSSPTWSHNSQNDSNHDIEPDDNAFDAEKQYDSSCKLSSNNTRVLSGNKANYSSRKCATNLIDKHNNNSSLSRSYNSKKAPLSKDANDYSHSSIKCASNVFVQTEYSGEIAKDTEENESKMSPLYSSDSTIKENDQTLQCCCTKSLTHRNRKSSRPHRKLKKNSLVRSLDRKLPEELEMLDNEVSIMDKTSFIPPKSWYSLGSLCDENENCKTCCQNWRYDTHRNLRLYDSDTKLNISGDAVSYNDTGYTSTEEESSSGNSADMKGDGSSCDHQSSPENGSYDGDYESDDEIFQVRLVGSEDMVYKPIPSISEPFGIQAYAAKEWTSDTPKAKAIREGYAAIPNHVSCHQLRQIRGDNYCAIRATLFQALLNGVPVLKNLSKDGIPKVLRTILSTTSNVLQEWSFAGRISIDKSEVISTLEEILEFFIDEVQKCEDITSRETKTDHLLFLFNEETGNAEFKLLEAVKLMMLYNAVNLYEGINQGSDVPVLAVLLFSRDTSVDPRGLLRNHLNCVGDTGGLEQVEMCLLGYSLGVVIQVFRPSQVSQSDFIANFPYLEDMPAFSPTVSLVAEDDRHYNIVVE